MNKKLRKEYILKRFRSHIRAISQTKSSPRITNSYDLSETLKVYHLPYTSPPVSYEIKSIIYPNSVMVQLSNDKLFFTGGDPVSSTSNFAGIFHLSTKRMEPVAKMLVPREHHQVAAIFTHTTYVYVIGGKNGSYLNSCERYEELRNAWTFTAPLNDYKEVRTVMPYQNRFIYAFGGRGFNTRDYKTRIYRRVERLDLASEETGWTIMTPIIEGKETGDLFWRELLTAQSFRSINPHEIMIFERSDMNMWWDITRGTVRHKRIVPQGYELDPAIIESKGYVYFMKKIADGIMTYSHLRKKFRMKVLHPTPWEQEEGEGEDSPE